MNNRVNSLGQPVGYQVPHWKAVNPPPKAPIAGRYCRIEPIDVDRHAADLFEAISDDADGRTWTYMAYGPFGTLPEYRAWMKATCLGADPLFHAVIDTATNKAVGVASYLRIDPKFGVIEVGHIHYSPRLQDTRAGTEAMYLMMCRVFEELGYRRYEWKCDALNKPSCHAAERLGFSYEGTFRQATMYKSRNRDTAWFAMIDHEWPALKAAYETWLEPGDFDARGQQQQSLAALTAAALKSSVP
jgi:RimJ/RimL family protein N-acetyltransferase